MPSDKSLFGVLILPPDLERIALSKFDHLVKRSEILFEHPSVSFEQQDGFQVCQKPVNPRSFSLESKLKGSL